MTRYEITRSRRIVVSLDLAARPYATPSTTGVKVWLSGNPCLVPGCGYLAGDGYVCPTCVEAWEVQLGNVAALVEDLEVAERKQVRFGDPGPRGGRVDKAIPIDKHDRVLFADSRIVASADEQTVGPGNKEADGHGMTVTTWINYAAPQNRNASYALDRLRNELVGQIRLICESGHIRVPELGADTVAMSRWLLRQSARLAYLPEADGWGLIHDLDQMTKDCLSVIDAPARRKYVRECECGLAVYTASDRARCACGAEYDTEAEHEARMEIARDRLVTAHEAATLAKVKPSLIRQWIKRGRVEVLGEIPVENARGETRDAQVVRYGDVLALIESGRVA